ncbi:MAG: triose-phosphate isomerase, partial [Verrucomicrobiota bacterium]
MDKARRLIIAGNWKCNKTVAESVALVTDLKRELTAVKEVDIVVCPAFTALDAVSREVIESNLRLGAQNMGDNGYGAFTGEIAPGMLRDLSVRFVILGHSERRQYQREDDALVARKALAAHAHSLIPIVCVGETLNEREAGITARVVEGQVRGSLA